jgi:hypothetical protein
MLIGIRSVDTSLEQRLHGMKHSEFGNRIIWLEKRASLSRKERIFLKYRKRPEKGDTCLCSSQLFGNVSKVLCSMRREKVRRREVFIHDTLLNFVRLATTPFVGSNSDMKATSKGFQACVSW